jgi:hypothetical protein
VRGSSAASNGQSFDQRVWFLDKDANVHAEVREPQTGSLIIAKIVRFDAWCLCNHRKSPALSNRYSKEERSMKKTLAILATVATVGATAITAPAQARGIGPGLAFGLAAGAIAAGAAGAYGYYGPGYGYYGYGPGYYGPAYNGPGYAYYGGPYWRHRYWHRHYW